MQDALFYLFAALTLICGGLVVANPISRNPVTSAMFLVLTILSMAGLFVLLEAFFLAAVQVLVDGSDSNTASTVASYASRVIGSFSLRYLGNRQRALLMNVQATTGMDQPLNAELPSVKTSDSPRMPL